MSTKITTLSNGLRIVTDHVPSVESVAVGVWIGAGARHEALSHIGTAHMVEHMLFKGTEKRDAPRIAEEIENVGGHMNAYTSRELTSYHIHLLKEDTPLALDVLADIVQHSTMPDDEIERERDVILQEIGMCHDTPDDIIFDRYFEAAYHGQTVGTPILGTPEIIRDMDRDTLMNFVQSHYTPERLVISAAGNLDHDSFVQNVEKLFCALPEKQGHDKGDVRYTGGEYRESRDLEQSHIILGFEGLNQLDEQFYTARALSTLLGGGMSSRLFQEVREKRGLVYSIYSFHSSYSDSAQFGIYAGTGPEKLPELMPVICDEIQKIFGTITEEELERTKAQLRSTTLMARESMMSRADQNAKSMLLRNFVRTPEETISLINAVDIDLLEQVAQRIFSTPPTLAALGPLGTLEKFESIKAKLSQAPFN